MTGFPRVRGDGPSVAMVLIARLKFPPRARGWTLGSNGPHRTLEVSPACAGMDPLVIARISPKYSFPRVRGDGPHRGL